MWMHVWRVVKHCSLSELAQQISRKIKRTTSSFILCKQLPIWCNPDLLSLLTWPTLEAGKCFPLPFHSTCANKNFPSRKAPSAPSQGSWLRRQRSKALFTRRSILCFLSKMNILKGLEMGRRKSSQCPYKCERTRKWEDLTQTLWSLYRLWLEQCWCISSNFILTLQN